MSATENSGDAVDPMGTTLPEREGGAPIAIRDIAQRLNASPRNPVSRARLWVESEIPESRRGPGWDRHWRELEAYADAAAIWSGVDGTIAPVDDEPDEDED